MATTLNNFDYANVFSVYTDENGLEFYNLYNTVKFDEDIDPSLYVEHLYTSTDDWYGISSKYYNSPRLWWLILAANRIANPFEELPAGTKLKILKSDIVSEVLNQIELAK